MQTGMQWMGGVIYMWADFVTEKMILTLVMLNILYIRGVIRKFAEKCY